jgi:DNA-binding GntR family transcriptional regulator
MTLASAAYDRIRELLAAGEFPPGCHLVNQELSRRIGVGVTPVREAVTRLASEGLLEHLPGAGMFVRQPTTADVLQLLDLRAVLEPFAIQQAAEHRTEGDLRAAGALLAEEFLVIREVAAAPDQRASGEQVKRWLLIERRFHGLILEAARNPWLAKAAADVSLLAIVFSAEQIHAADMGVGGMIRSWRDHRRLLRFVRQRRGQQAADLIRRHLATGRQSNDKPLVRSRTPLPARRLAQGLAGQADTQPLARRRGRPPGSTKAARRDLEPRPTKRGTRR